MQQYLCLGAKKKKKKKKTAFLKGDTYMESTQHNVLSTMMRESMEGTMEVPKGDRLF